MAMTKSQIQTTLAESTGLSKKQIVTVFDELAALSYAEAKNGFTIPGIGKLVLVNRKERMGRNPATGAQILIPAKTVVKFRIAKVCKEGVLS